MLWCGDDVVLVVEECESRGVKSQAVVVECGKGECY
jgi:hypothetical protein